MLKCYNAAAANNSSTPHHLLERVTSLLEFHENLSGVNWRHQQRRVPPRYEANLYCMSCRVATRPVSQLRWPWPWPSPLRDETIVDPSPICYCSVIHSSLCPAFWSLQANTKCSKREPTRSCSLNTCLARAYKCQSSQFNVVYHNCTSVNYKTSCGARHNKPRPCCHLANDTDLLTPVVWAMAGDNKQIDLWSELTQNRIRSSGRPMVTPHLPWKFHANRFSRFLVMLLTKKQRNRPKTIPCPPTGGGVIIYVFIGVPCQNYWAAVLRQLLA